MLEPKIKQLAQRANYAIVSTVMPDGHLQTLPLWVDADDEHILLNTEIGRQRYKNLQRDPHITVLIVDGDDFYSWAEVRGKLVGEVRGQPARDHIDVLSRKYTGHEYTNPIGTERVILRIAPDHQLLR
jgi:PPOX class probable F420-dependent enzyme